ncbi:purine nucleoside permease [Halobacteria archaeon AArc-dxtr1]|nr:purine nucleoside permease [Halobacteria archaeon AArc-dxtr1]
MTDSSLPDPRPPGDDPVRPRALVLPAVAAPPLDERGPWLEREKVDDALNVPSLETPLYLTDAEVAITTTGIGKSDAATTVAAMTASPAVDLSDAYVVSAGIGGAAPERAALGSVFVADAVVDWDRKHRWDRAEVGEDHSGSDSPGGWDDGERPIDLLSYRPRDYVRELDEELVAAALEAADGVDLATDETVREYQRGYPDAPADGPTVDVGTTVCGDEFWHGPHFAAEVDWLCEAYGVGPYATTQMEDAATATALERFGLGDRYLSVRAVANYDRSAPGESVEESFDGIPESLELGIENAARVGSAVVGQLVERDPLGIR